jgi:hypothetical protein
MQHDREARQSARGRRDGARGWRVKSWAAPADRGRSTGAAGWSSALARRPMAWPSAGQLLAAQYLIRFLECDFLCGE